MAFVIGAAVAFLGAITVLLLLFLTLRLLVRPGDRHGAAGVGVAAVLLVSVAGLARPFRGARVS